MPSYFNRRFVGRPKGTREQAENATIRDVFLQDADVLDVAEKLPPTMDSIRQFTVLSTDQKKECRDQGIDRADLHRQLQHCIYMGFRELGCRNAVWDQAA
eukprot:Skav213287  [mRNA]  locus=scaffold2236:80465:80764:- [translate_table: standard]